VTFIQEIESEMAIRENAKLGVKPAGELQNALVWTRPIVIGRKG
jgi:hypothetical protein